MELYGLLVQIYQSWCMTTTLQLIVANLLMWVLDWNIIKFYIFEIKCLTVSSNKCILAESIEHIKSELSSWIFEEWLANNKCSYLIYGVWIYLPLIISYGIYHIITMSANIQNPLFLVSSKHIADDFGRYVRFHVCLAIMVLNCIATTKWRDIKSNRQISGHFECW